VGGSGRHSDNFFAGALVGKFGVKEPVPDMFFPPGVCGSTSIESGQDDNVTDNGFLWISSISFFRDSMAS